MTIAEKGNERRESGGFGHSGRLAFREHHASLGKQTLCQLSYSRSEQKELWQIGLWVE